MVIRKEQPEDYDLTDSVVKKAFMQAEYSDKTEQALVKALGKSSACIPELSLAAETDGKIAGFIMFTRAWIGDSEILALAPLAVLPEYLPYNRRCLFANPIICTAFVHLVSVWNGRCTIKYPLFLLHPKGASYFLGNILCIHLMHKVFKRNKQKLPAAICISAIIPVNNGYKSYT